MASSLDGTPRRMSYVWVTWITGLVSGDKNCWWASWFRAHYQDYEKLTDPNANRLTLWKAEHAKMVGDVGETFRANNYIVTLEDQNKLNVKGESAILGAKPDIVAQPVPLFGATRDAVIVDCKTGRPRDSDYWQVVAYVALATMKHSPLHGKRVVGRVVYKDHPNRDISQDEVLLSKQLLWEAVRKVGDAAEPVRVPSAIECMTCDIACCPERISPLADTAQVETEDF